MIFSKNNLLETDYNWNTDMLHSALAPAAMFFNRFSGDNIVRMINLFNSLVAAVSLQEGQEIERLLVKELPLQINDEINVFNWLKARYPRQPGTSL